MGKLGNRSASPFRDDSSGFVPSRFTFLYEKCIILKSRRTSRGRHGAHEQYRDFVVSALVEDTPRQFWERLIEKTRFAYGEAFSAVSADPALLDDQREQKLFQERYFKLEHTLIATGKRTGVPGSAKLVGENRCHYAYVARGRVGMTQSYVAVSGEMPKPAAFRKQLAEMAMFKRIWRLDLGAK